MKLNKKFMSLLTVLFVSFGILAACGGANDAADTTDATEEETTQEEETEEEGADTVSAASESANPEDLVGVMTDGANWMFAATADITLETDLLVEAGHHRRNDPSEDLARKLGLYTQERETNDDGEVEVTITGEFTLTVPTIIVEAENFVLTLGTVDGDVIVDAPGFHLNGATITGNLIFTSEEYQESANLVSEIEGFDSEVQGETKVAE